MSEDRADSFEGLPPTLREIAEVTDLHVALALAEQFGGTALYIPARASSKHALVKCVGQKAANRICERFRILTPDNHELGVRLLIPLANTGTIAKAQRKLAKLLEDGVSIRAAARRSGLHIRTVFRMKERLRGNADNPQGRLF